MGFFTKILEKLGLKKEAPAQPVASTIKPTVAPPATPKPAGTAAAPAAAAAAGKDELDSLRTAGPAQPAVKAVPEVDVVKHLEQLAKGSGLDWKVSIVDLLKLLDIDSSRETRNELATELGCPADLMSDSAKMNVWLHKTVLKKIAENGGNIPQALLD
jgi:hypothetical protein